MSTKVWIAMLAGGFAGALIWAGIAASTGYEVGYIAWGVGLLVGGCAKFMGGEGKVTAITCAAVTLGSILGGKALAVSFIVSSEIRSEVSEMITRERYDEIALDAKDFPDVQSEDDYPSFMVSHGYTESTDPSKVTQDELQFFIEYQLPRLRRFRVDEPEYEAWHESETEDAVELVMEEIDYVEAVKDGLGLMDILFAFLGLGSAYKLVLGDGN